jgi:hypothetical protein
MTFLSRSRFAHDLATLDGLLLTRGHADMPVGLKVIGRKRAIMMHMCVKRQHQRRPLLHDPNARVATAMDPTLVAFGTFEPTFQIQIVYREIGCLATHKQPRLKAAQQLGEMLVNGVGAGLPRLLQHAKPLLPLAPCDLVARSQGTVHGLQLSDISPHLCQRLTCSIEAAINATAQTRQQRLYMPPFFACRLRSSESRTSCNASLIRTPGG